MAQVTEDAVAKAREFLSQAQDKKRRDIDPHCRPVDFAVSDLV